MPRAWVWIPLLIGWLPVWVLFTVLFMSVHQEPWQRAAPVALRQMLTAALLGLLVHRLTLRLPWPYPLRLRFVAIHALGAAGYAVAWLLFNSLIDSIRHGQLVLNLGPGAAPYLITGVWFYVMIAGIGYANRTAERAAQIAMLEARSQLAALRMQLQPHFLFNALHTVVQLIPLDPRGAVRATEQLAGLLRTTIEEQRDLVPLQTEWAFVQRYLAIEGIRFGERLVVRSDIDAAALACKLPSFALQTLVENAVRHAAAPSIEPTTLRIAARLDAGQLSLSVADDGPGMEPDQLERSTGTGLRRLRERLAWLYGGSARLQFRRTDPHGLTATLTLPQIANGDDDE